MGFFSAVEDKIRLDALLQEIGLNKGGLRQKRSVEGKKIFRRLGKKIALSRRLVNCFQQAGVPLRIEEIVFTALFAAAVITFLIISNHVVQAVVVGIVAIFFPALWLASMRRKRLQKFNSQLGEALVLMANSLRAGFSFLQAMDLISKESPVPLRDEFSMVLREIQLGVPTEKALAGMAERIASADLEMMVTAVLIQRQVGGNLAEVLEKIAGTIKERVRIKGEIKTLTAQGRISGIIIGLLPMVLAAVLIFVNPEYIKVLISDPIGPVLIFFGLLSQLLGALMIKKIVSLGL